MKNLHKRILSVGVACSSLVGMAFVSLPKQPKGILTSLNLAVAKSELEFLDSFANKKGPEKETSDNSSPKTETTFPGFKSIFCAKLASRIIPRTALPATVLNQIRIQRRQQVSFLSM